MLKPVFAKVWAAYGRGGHAGRTVTVKVKYADFRQITRSRSGADVVRSRKELERASLDLLRPCFPPPRGIHLLGVTISNLAAGEPRDRPQLALTLGTATDELGAGRMAKQVARPDRARLDLLGRTYTSKQSLSARFLATAVCRPVWS